MAVIYKGVPRLAPDKYENLYVLLRPLRVLYETRHGERKAITIPKGYKTDGASIPRLLWEEVGSPFSPRFITASVVHDYHCNILDGKIEGLNPDMVSVEEISDLFYDILKADGVGSFKAGTMRNAVRLYKTFF